METCFHYKGYTIRYRTFGGTTGILDFGFCIKEFVGKGEIKGKELAKSYIDNFL